MANKNENIKFLFEPSNVAIIGASNNENKIGYKIVRNIVNGGFKGGIFPINPHGGEILGNKVYKSIEDVKTPIDIVSIVVPAERVLDAVKSCVKMKVKHAMIITSGFSETGNTELETQIVKTAEEGGMRVLGPNIFGIYSSASSFNGTFSAAGVLPGNVAILTQSGALGIAMIGKTAVENIGLSCIVSLGNKADIDEADLLDYIVAQDATRVILMYIEGIRGGEKFLESIKKAGRIKPVVVIKSGRSKRGAMAAASHTGSLAGADDVFGAVIKQCGAMRAESLDEAFSWCKFLASTEIPRGNNSIIITNGGGVGVMATDACEKYSINLFDDNTMLKEIFGSVTPDFGSTKNPIDITGGAGADEYNKALDAAAKNENIDSTIALYCETATFDAENLSGMVKENYEHHRAMNKPIIFSLVGGESTVRTVDSLRKQNIPVFPDVYEAVSCLGSIYSYSRYLNAPVGSAETAAIDEHSIKEIIKTVYTDFRSFLLANEGQGVMNASGITVPQTKIAKSLDEAVSFAESIGYPVVMKVVSRDILHKSDAGGVILDLENKAEVIDAYQAILFSCRKYKADAVIDGIEISEMVKKGTELIIGARNDKSFGPIVMCGLGGVYVEVMKDVTFRSFPLSRLETMSMLKEIRSYPLLLGVRGEEPGDIEAVVDTIIKVGTIIKKIPLITDIEINPLVVYEKGMGVKAVDVRIILSNIERQIS